jgi:hypothetical protein
MIPSLEELRKKLLATPEPLPADPQALKRPTFGSTGRGRTPPVYNASRRPQPLGTPIGHQRIAPIRTSETEVDNEPLCGEETIYLGDAGAGRHSDIEAEAASIAGPEEAVEIAEFQSHDQLVEAAAAFFGSAGEYREHLRQLAVASRSVLRLSRVADKALEPLKAFRDQAQELLSFYANPTGARRQRLNTLVWLSPTEKPTRSGDDPGAVAFGGYLFEVSRYLGRAKLIHARLVELVRMLRAADALQAQMRALSHALDAIRIDHADANPRRAADSDSEN